MLKANEFINQKFTRQHPTTSRTHSLSVGPNLVVCMNVVNYTLNTSRRKEELK